MVDYAHTAAKAANTNEMEVFYEAVQRNFRHVAGRRCTLH